MHILCVGLSHRTAPVDVRERVALGEEDAAAALRELHGRYPHAEMALLSTCNRTEFYLARPLHGHPRVEELVGFLADRSGLSAEALSEHVRHRDNEQAIRHLMRVASGLDSMVLGEGQVLGQVKRAYELGQSAGTVGKVLHEVFRAALSAAKEVRRETGIGAGRTSVSSVAVDFARHLFHDFADKTVLVLGAGKMTELTLRHFLELGPGRVLVCNRSAAKARPLAEKFGGQPAALADLGDLLVEADVVISSTGSQRPVVTAELVRPLIGRRRFRPLFVIDIAVPRDVEPAVGRLANVYLYDMDDLQAAISDQMAQRNGQVAACDALIERSVAACYAAVQTEDFGELIRRLRRELHRIGASETRRTLNKLREASPEEARALLDEHTRRLVNKILHRPISELGRGRGTEAAMYATALRRLFELDAEAEDLSPPESREVEGQRSEIRGQHSDL